MLIGIDMVDIERLKLVVNRTPRFLTRVFTPGEIKYCMGKSNPFPSLAARFAAKEAFRKLHPVFVQGVRFHEVEVVIGEQGRPELTLHGQALHKCLEHHIGELGLSLSHTHQQAVAAVIARKG